MTARRVYLMADFGKGMHDYIAKPNQDGWRVKFPNGSYGSLEHFTSACAPRAWWLVESESADAARETIVAAQREAETAGQPVECFGVKGTGPAVCNQPGRILASGGGK